MKMVVCSVLDKAVGAYLTPFFCRSKGEAVRSFMDACSDEKHRFALHADDYLLVEIGLYDDNSGLISAWEPRRIISARECLNSSAQGLTQGFDGYINGRVESTETLPFGDSHALPEG